MRIKKKKSLIAIIALLSVAIVGATFAYYTSSTSFENVFNTGFYKVVVTEEFESPDNWAPGEFIPKTVTSTNEGTVPAAVRISYTEQWLDEEENDITSQVTPNPAIINFDNTNDWTQENNYYYYKYILNPNDETSSFISGVTLDSNLNGVTCTGSGNTKTCEGTNQATGSTYKLTLTIETVQADKYQNVWNTNVSIVEKPKVIQLLNSERDKDNLQLGDEICANGDTTECFNFIGYDGNNIKLLSKYNLNVGNNIQPGAEGVQNSLAIGWNEDDSTAANSYYPATVVFSGINYWADGSNLKSKYGSAWNTNNIYDTDYNDATGNNYSVAYYVENYKNILESYGLTVNDARLLTYSEATDSSIGCSGSSCSGFITNTSFWLGSAYDSNFLWFVSSDGDFDYDEFNNDRYYGVRPVIVISKSDI